MSSSNGYKIIIESRGNKLSIYYENSAIYCKMVDFYAKSKETILVSNVYDNFFYSKSHDDNIYLLCEGKEKNFLFVTFDNNGWHIEELNLRKDFGNIIPLGLFALTDGIHIVFAKKLLLEYYYDLFLLKKSNNDWEKSFICEVYSKAIKNSEIIKMTGYNNLHLISTLYDGQSLSLNYFLYEVTSSRWSHIPIVNLNSDDIYISTSVHDNNLNLFCYNFDNKTLNIYYFSKSLLVNSAFSLIDIIKLNIISKDIVLIIDVISDILKVNYIYNNCYYENSYSIVAKQWINFKKIPLHQLPVLHYVKIFKDISDNDFEERKNICSVNDMLEIGLPFDNMDILDNQKAIKDKDSLNNTSLILDHMNLLTEKIEDLSRKLSKIEDKKASKKSFESKYEDDMDYHEEHRQVLRHSNFKEKFMKSKPRTIKLENSSILTGVLSSVEPSLLKNNDNKGEAPNKIINNKSNKEEVSNNIIINKNNKEEVFNEEHPNKPKGFIKTVAKWFKE
ncbi:hypothetical protein [Lutispora sp.]|uniref:hypothetical protein n=1 Tax=Lutispora sp. TaxID=2828727 RepID=UPI0035654C0A